MPLVAAKGLRDESVQDYVCGAKDKSSRSFAVVFLSNRVVPTESYVFFRIQTDVMGGGIDRLSPCVLCRFSGWCIFALASSI